MAWIVLVIAGIFETGWAIGLKYTDGFTKFWPSVFTIIGNVISVYLLAWSAKELDIGTAYSVWVGIGAAGAIVLGIVLFKEPATFGRMFFIALLMIAIVGLKYTSHQELPK